MSFLAQLRQHPPSAAQTLQLCYLLEIQHTSNILALRLCVTELQQGQLHAAGKAYQIQRQHLLHPPPFITPADKVILQRLIEADAAWLQQTEGPLPAIQDAQLLLDMLASQHCFIQRPQGGWQKLLPAPSERVDLAWVVDIDGGQQLRWQAITGGKIVFSAPNATTPWVYHRDPLQLAVAHHRLGASALQALQEQTGTLPPEQITAFLQRHQASWQPLGLPLPQELPPLQHLAKITPVLHFSSRSSPRDRVELAFRYSSDLFCSQFPLAVEARQLDYWDGTQLHRLIRQDAAETAYLEQLHPYLAQHAPTNTPGCWVSDSANVWQQLLTQSRGTLEQLGFQFHIESGFRHHYVIPTHWRAEIEVTQEQVLQLCLQLELAGERINLLELLKQLQEMNHLPAGDNRCFTLPDGRLLLLPADKVNGIMAELGDLLTSSGTLVRLPRSQLNRLDGLHQQLPDATQWQGALDRLEQAISLHQTPALLEQVLTGVEAELRPYQWLGVCWLQHLKRHQLNGLLADDMGLGKTLQTLAHLSLERQQGQLQQPALIIAPTSLIHNWEAEIERFTPQLRYKIVHGSKRHQQWDTLQDYDILISSYQLIVNDLSNWQEQALSWIILDEAQQIKNPRTRVSQAVRALESDFKLCLSGTPMENHLGELWALLDFLNPDCLGRLADFRHYYQKPIEQQAHGERMVQLQSRIAPFILRRTKDQVAKDLPAKIETHQYISLADDQQAFYDAQKSCGASELQQQLADTEHSGQQQILLLTALLRLRQACCDPLLLGETDISSAKREHCIEMVEELVAENRAILIFSQFTSMLDLLAQALDKLAIDYLQLTGKSRNRQQLVDAFQRGEAPVFLISLKAGGVGLNLTRADTVIHYDPWWNSAAEQQATDRAHRIGQDKPVFVYKLIAENTIEEKIAQLQQHKASISQHINQQAQITGERFALKMADLMHLWQQETEST